MDKFKIRTQLLIFYLIGMLIPLIIVDAIIFNILVSAEKERNDYEMSGTAEAVSNTLVNRIMNTAVLAENINRNKQVNAFLATDYASLETYVNRWQKIRKDTLNRGNIGYDAPTFYIYVDNDTIVNGGGFARLDKIADAPWLRDFEARGEAEQFRAFYDYSPVVHSGQRVFYFIREMDFYNKEQRKILTLKLDGSALDRFIKDLNYQVPIYVCADNKILFSNRTEYKEAEDFETFDLQAKVGYEKDLPIYGTDLQVYILSQPVPINEIVKNNSGLLLFLLALHILQVIVMISLLNHSLVERITELSKVFRNVNADHIPKLERARGRDEIGKLMSGYNEMADRMNHLIDSVYRNQIKEQNMSIARQQSELKALQSQINPHFLFNALESIRMHSLLKYEYETAEMVENLALMVRQNVDWGEDLIPIEDELEFVRAYLELQKYRFDKKFNYDIEMDEALGKHRIPRLSIVTFVENACVHGIENKCGNSWLFVRVYEKEGNCLIEIEDTGVGMKEDECQRQLQRMREAGWEDLKAEKQVGMLNASIRLRLLTDNRVRFALQSEEQVGTTVEIAIPMDSLRS
jgi:two-component system sensor histidine kinase YesM